MAAVDEGSGGMLAGRVGMRGGAPAAGLNSGKSPRVRQSSVPASFARVSKLARPPAIQERICSTLAGPYSFPSPPMMVNMGGTKRREGGASMGGRDEAGYAEIRSGGGLRWGVASDRREASASSLFPP